MFRRIVFVLSAVGIGSLALFTHARMDTYEGRVAFLKSASVQPVNAVVGDAGFVAVFGRLPESHTSEELWLKSHLAYVEQLLRAAPDNHLTAAQFRRRSAALDYLRAYWQAGIFPHNTTHRGRRTPVFIDHSGRICAVGYLVEKTAGLPLAEAVSRTYRYAHIDEMDMPALDKWAERNGFTRRELAMIQPAYCWRLPTSDQAAQGHKPALGCEQSSDKMNKPLEVAIVGANISMAVLNGWMVAQSRRSLLAAGAGLASGGAGLAIGLSDRANFETADLIFSGLSLALSGWNVIQRTRTPATPLAYRPSVTPVWLASRGQFRPGIRAIWSL